MSDEPETSLARVETDNTPDAYEREYMKGEGTVVYRDKMVAGKTMKGLADEVKSFDKIFSKSGKELTDLYKDHSANAASMIDAMEEINASWDAAQQRAIDFRFELKESLTEEEWKSVFGE